MEPRPDHDGAGVAAHRLVSVLGMTDAPTLDAASRETSDTQRRGLRMAVALAVAEDTIYALLFLAVLQTYLLEELSAGAASPGYTIALFSAVVLVTNPAAGALLDRTSTRLVLASAGIVQVGAIAVLVTVASFGGVLAAAVLLGVGASAAWPAVYQAVAATHLPPDRARASSTLALAGYVSTAIGLTVGVILTSFASVLVGFTVAGAIAFTPIALLRLSPARALGSGTSRDGRPAGWDRGDWSGVCGAHLGCAGCAVAHGQLTCPVPYSSPVGQRPARLLRPRDRPARPVPR